MLRRVKGLFSIWLVLLLLLGIVVQPVEARSESKIALYTGTDVVSNGQDVYGDRIYVPSKDSFEDYHSVSVETNLKGLEGIYATELKGWEVWKSYWTSGRVFILNGEAPVKTVDGKDYILTEEDISDYHLPESYQSDQLDYVFLSLYNRMATVYTGSERLVNNRFNANNYENNYPLIVLDTNTPLDEQVKEILSTEQIEELSGWELWEYDDYVSGKIELVSELFNKADAEFSTEIDADLSLFVELTDPAGNSLEDIGNSSYEFEFLVPVYEHRIKEQPSSDNDYTTIGTGTPSLYTWYYIKEVDNTIANAVKEDYHDSGSSYEDGKWIPTSAYEESGDYYADYFTIELDEGDTLHINVDGNSQGLDYIFVGWVGDSNIDWTTIDIDSEGYVKFIAPFNGKFLFELGIINDVVPTLTATLERVVNSANKLDTTNSKDGDKYICYVEWADDTVLVSNPVTYTAEQNDNEEIINPTPVEPPKSTVEFVVDGKVWRTYRVTKGADIKMPEVPEKEGHVGTWSHDGKGIRTTTTINAVYTKLANTTDLSAYSNDQLEVYKNSRVHTLTAGEEDTTVSGYMFKYKADCNTPNSIWREIIFVREDNYDTKYAYRKQVDSIYAPWLNTNPNPTVNFTYNLDYANYSVTFSLDDVNAYEGNTPVDKMESGSYLMYMRISDGVNSNIMPLVDRVLSDGTTMENTGTLPKEFEVVDQETRVLRYVVE